MPEAIRDKYQYFTEANLARLRAAGYTARVTALEDAVARLCLAIISYPIATSIRPSLK